MRLRSSSSFLFFVVSMAGWALGGCASAPVTREDDAYHFARSQGGEHEVNFMEWWYFNLVDPDHGVQAIFAYSVIDPTNRTGLGMASVLALVYAAGGPLQEGAYLPLESLAGSAEQADVTVGDDLRGGGGSR